jgi:hypothetical protein
MNFLVTFCSGAYCLPLHRLGSELVHVSFAHAIVTIAILFLCSYSFLPIHGSTIQYAHIY